MLEELLQHDKWIDFFNLKDNGFLPKFEYNKLKEFIDKKEYLPISKAIVNNTYTFSTPIRHEIANKNEKGRKSAH